MTEESQETLVWRGTPSQWTNLGAYLGCLLAVAAVAVAAWYFPARSPAAVPEHIVLPLALGLAALPVLYAFVRWLRTRCNVYEITSERIKVRTGIASRHMTELELYRVRDYSVVEPFWLRLAGCGNVVLTTSDRTTPEIVLRAVPKAAGLKDQIRFHTEKMRQRRGVRDIEIDSPPPDAPPPPAS